jgi:hypothetical protein
MRKLLTSTSLPVATLEAAIIGQQTHGDRYQAVAGQLEAMLLRSAVASRRGHVSPCRVVYQTATMRELKIARCIPLETDYAGIWIFLAERMGRVLVRDGITSMSALLAPGSPIKVGFAREMPGAEGYPDEIISDGNDEELKAQAHTSLLVDALSGYSVCDEHSITFK